MMDPRTSAQDLMRCDLCEIAMVQMHCDTCLVKLCKACVGEHCSADFSKPHKIMDFKDRKSTPLYPGCISHDKERSEMYCDQCDISVCVKCIASGKHLSHKIITILQAYTTKKENVLKNKTELNDTIFPTYQDIASDLEKKISQLEKEYGDLSTAITKHGEDCHSEIDKLVQKLKAEAEDMKTTQLHTLQKQLEEVNRKISDIKDEISSMDVHLDSNDMSKVFINATTNVDEYKKLPQKFVLSLPKFTPVRIQGEFCKLFGTLSLISVQSKEHGYSIKTTQKSPEAASSPVIKQLLDESQTVTTIHTDYPFYLYSVACLSDEEIWTRGGSSSMKLYSINQGTLLKSITTKSGTTPWDIAVTNSGDLVYTDYNDRTVNIVKNEEIQTMITLQNWKPCGVCSTSSGDLLVTMESVKDRQSKVVHYSDSTETQTIQFDDQGQPLYSSGAYNRYITENRNLDICVTDSVARAVVVVNQAGKLRFRYTGHTPAPKNKPFGPRGITTDSQSHILTSDYSNDCVHIIDQDGQFLRYIDCGLRGPWGLCIDTNDNLFVAQYSKKQVKKIKYLQ